MPLKREVRKTAEYIDKASGEKVELPKEKLDYRYITQLHGMGKTYKEIAEKCGTTEQVIKNMMYRKRKEKAEAEQNKRPRGRPKGSRNKQKIAEEQALVNWENNPVSPMMREDKADLNRAAGWFVGQCWTLGKTVDPNNIDSLYNALEKYVMLCTQSGMPMLVKTCHLALGLNSSTINAWRNGKYRSDDPRYREFVQIMDAIIAAGIEAAGAAGSLDRVLTIWFEKAHFGLYEQQGIVVEDQSALGEKRTAKEIVEKYSEILPEDN